MWGSVIFGYPAGLNTVNSFYRSASKGRSDIWGSQSPHLHLTSNHAICLLGFKPMFSSVQSLSRVQVFVTPWTAARHTSLSITSSRSLPKLMSIELLMPSNHVILCHPLLLPPSIFPSIRIFSNELAFRIRWPMYWSFSLSISPSNEYSGLISFRMDWLDLLAVQGTLKSLLQHHSSKADDTLLTLALDFPGGPVVKALHFL